MSRKICPSCSSRKTRHEDAQWFPEKVVEIRSCNKCKAEYKVNFADMIKEARG